MFNPQNSGIILCENIVLSRIALSTFYALKPYIVFKTVTSLSTALIAILNVSFMSDFKEIYCKICGIHS